MGWWSNLWRTVPSPESLATEPPEITELALTAAAHLIQATGPAGTRIAPKYDTWQDELWNYYDTLGEFNIAVTWRSYMMSRVRLRAAKLKPGSDEPEIQDTGPAADLVNELFNGTSGQSEMMGNLSVMMDVPAECWLVGETRNGCNDWRVLSSDELRRRGKGFEVITEDSVAGDEKWRPLSSNSYTTRIWKPHKRKRYLPYSQAFAARSAMRELELVNRHIIAQYLSRLASAGVILFPDEIEFPVRPEFLDAPNPFVREWIEMAAEAIKTPGAASSIVPMPFKVPAEYVDKIKHIDFTLKLDEKIIEKRDSARNRLAAMINVPAELLFQAADVNHWTLWQLEEGAIRTYIAPDAEIIVDALTRGYLRPRLKALGQNDGDDIIWYDTSELSVRPDKSENAIQAYDRLELSGKAMRRETGFDEDDAPTNDELADLILKKLAVQPQLAVIALNKLTGLKLEQPQVNPGAAPPPGNEDEDDEDDEAVETSSDGAKTQGAPATRDDAPPQPNGKVSADVTERDAFTVLQAKTQHMIEFGGITGEWKLKHPPLCQPKLFSCPFTHVTYPGIPVHPGTPGNYACWLSTTGELIIGDRVFTPDDSFIPSPPRSGTNGTRSRALTR